MRIFDNMFRGDRDAVAELVATGDVELIEQDVRYGGAVHQAMKGCTHVIHFAAVSINKSQADPYESIDINMVGNHNVFAAAADHGVDRLVFASSASVYGDPERLPMHEDDHAAPAHAVLHLQARRRGPARLLPAPGRACRGSRCGSSTSTARARRPTAYYTSVINHFVNRLRAGEPPVIDGSGEQSMDFVHVHDIARSVVLALESERRQPRRSTSAPASTPPSPTLAGDPHRRPSAPTWSRSSPAATCWSAAGPPTPAGPARCSASSRPSRSGRAWPTWSRELP